MSDDALKTALDEARALLERPKPVREPVGPALAAAAFFALSAAIFAVTSLLVPPVQSHAPPAQASTLRGIN